MITYIHSTTIIVGDQERALDFYVNTLGWEVRIDQMMGDDYRFLTVAPVGGQSELVLGPAHILGGEPGVGISRGRGMEGASGISFCGGGHRGHVPGARGARRQLRGPLEDMPWGDKATWLMDPDGNRFFFTGR